MNSILKIKEKGFNASELIVFKLKDYVVISVDCSMIDVDKSQGIKMVKTLMKALDIHAREIGNSNPLWEE